MVVPPAVHSSTCVHMYSIGRLLCIITVASQEKPFGSMCSSSDVDGTMRGGRL
jgi:hypothetical protein